MWIMSRGQRTGASDNDGADTSAQQEQVAALREIDQLRADRAQHTTGGL